MIKIDVNRSLPTAKLGNSDSMQVGDWVLASAVRLAPTTVTRASSLPRDANRS